MLVIMYSSLSIVPVLSLVCCVWL